MWTRSFSSQVKPVRDVKSVGFWLVLGSAVLAGCLDSSPHRTDGSLDQDGQETLDAGSGSTTLFEGDFSISAVEPFVFRFQVPEEGAAVELHLELGWIVAGPGDGIRSSDAPGCASEWGSAASLSTGGNDQRSCGWLDGGSYEVTFQALNGQGHVEVIAT